MASKNNKKQIKAVYVIRDNGKGGSFWTKVGVAFTNSDGSLNLVLDAVPVGTGKLHVRDFNRHDEAAEEAA